MFNIFRTGFDKLKCSTPSAFKYISIDRGGSFLKVKISVFDATENTKSGITRIVMFSTKNKSQTITSKQY